MKRLLVIFILYSTQIICSSVAGGGASAGGGTVQGAIKRSNVSLESIADEYINYVKTGKGNSLLWHMVTDETLVRGYPLMNLSHEDVETVAQAIKIKLDAQIIQEFAYSILPAWLEQSFDNITDKLIKEFLVNIGLKYKNDNFENLGGHRIDAGVVRFLLQKQYQDLNGYRKYYWINRDKQNLDEAVEKEDEITSNISRDIGLMCEAVVHIEKISSIDQNSLENSKIQFVLVPYEDLRSYQVQLEGFLAANPEVTVILAFEDTVESIISELSADYDFILQNKDNKNIKVKDLWKNNDLFPILQKITKLVIAGTGIKNISDAFLICCIKLTSLVLPDGLEDVGDSFLEHCIRLTNLVLPQSLRETGDNFLYGCSGLTSLVLPESLQQVGNNFLVKCTGLTKLELPQGLTIVGSDFLAFCVSLTTLELPQALTSFENGFLGSCTGLRSLVLPENLTIAKDDFLYGCSGLTSLVLPKGLQQVGNNFLVNCTGLTKLELPQGLTIVGSGFLGHCTGLTNLVLPKGLQQIPDAFLAECRGLTSLVMPQSFKSIGKYFLYDCKRLKKFFMSQAAYDFLLHEYHYNFGDIEVKILNQPYVIINPISGLSDDQKWGKRKNIQKIFSRAGVKKSKKIGQSL